MNTSAQCYANSIAESINDGERGDAFEVINDALHLERDEWGNPEILITYGGPTCWVDPVNARVYTRVFGEKTAWATINPTIADSLANLCEELLADRCAA